MPNSYGLVFVDKCNELIHEEGERFYQKITLKLFLKELHLWNYFLERSIMYVESSYIAHGIFNFQEQVSVSPLSFLETVFSESEYYKPLSLNIKQTNIKVQMVFLPIFSLFLSCTAKWKKVSFCSAKDHQDKILASSLSLNP